MMVPAVSVHTRTAPLTFKVKLVVLFARPPSVAVIVIVTVPAFSETGVIVAVQFGAVPAQVTEPFATIVVFEEVIERRAAEQTEPSGSLKVKAIAEVAVLTVVD